MGTDNVSKQPKRRRWLPAWLQRGTNAASSASSSASSGNNTALLVFISFILPFFVLLAIVSSSTHMKRLPDARRRNRIRSASATTPRRNATLHTTSTAARAPHSSKQLTPTLVDNNDEQDEETYEMESTGDANVDAKAPIVLKLSPKQSATAGGIMLTLHGKNLGTTKTLRKVIVGGVECISVKSVTSYEAHCRVPEGTGSRLAVIPVVEGAPPAATPSASALFGYLSPRVHHVSPAHAPNSGGGVITIHGANFGMRESFPLATVGGLACTKTTWLSDTAVRCIVPKGSGARLAVHVTVCGCGEASRAPQSSAVVANSMFSYDEDAMRDAGKAVLKGSLLEKFDGPLIANRKMLAKNEYEGSFMDVATQQVRHFAIPPEYATVIPLDDWKKRHDSCAVVGNSGSLANGKFGEEIDHHSAVFRVHNAPTHRFEADVGSKTTYQIVDQFWSEQLMAAEGGPQEARWLIEDAVLVFWSSHSQETYVQMRQQFPAMDVVYLSLPFVHTYTEFARRIRKRIGDALHSDTSASSRGADGVAGDVMSSGWYALTMAQQVCRSVDVYGMDARTGKFHYYDDHDPGDGERERSSTEYLTYLAMQSQGMLRDVKDAVGAASMEDDEAGGSSAAPVPGAALTCQRRDCVIDCNGRGEAKNGTCECDPIYSGSDCSVDRLMELVPKLLENLSLRYNASLVMHKGEVNGTNIVLPDGITKGKLREGDNYKVDRALYHTLPDHDIKVKWGTCAVLGNSGQLLGKERGREIDAHDVVYRFNQAPVKGYEQFVGSRSTHESLNGYWVKQLLDDHRGYRWNWRSRETALILFEMFEPWAYVWKSRQQIFEKDRWWKMSYARLRRMHPDRNVIALSPGFVSWAYLTYRELKRRFQRNHMGRYPGEKPMSGFYAVLFLLQVCDEVDIYGFNPWRDGSYVQGRPETRYHYFDSAIPRPGSHSFDLARYIYQLIALHHDNVRVFD